MWSFTSSPLVTALLSVQIALVVLESAVSLIQTYVFAVLKTFYSNEVFYDKQK